MYRESLVLGPGSRVRPVVQSPWSAMDQARGPGTKPPRTKHSYTETKTALVRPPFASSRLGGVDVSAIAVGIDERLYWVRCRGARDELAVPAPPSCMTRHPDIGWHGAAHAECARTRI